MCLCCVFLELQTKTGKVTANPLQSEFPEGRQEGLVLNAS